MVGKNPPLKSGGTDAHHADHRLLIFAAVLLIAGTAVYWMAQLFHERAWSNSE